MHSKMIHEYPQHRRTTGGFFGCSQSSNKLCLYQQQKHDKVPNKHALQNIMTVKKIYQLTIVRAYYQIVTCGCYHGNMILTSRISEAVSFH